MTIEQIKEMVTVLLMISLEQTSTSEARLFFLHLVAVIPMEQMLKHPMSM